MPENIAKSMVDALIHNAEHDEHALVISKDGLLNCRKLSFSEKLNRNLGMGRASEQAIINYLVQHKQLLLDYAQELKKQGKQQELELVQNQINQLFESHKQEAPDVFSKMNENWMADLPEEAKAMRMNEFILPGTHDSAAYQLQFKNTPKGKWKKAARAIRLASIFGAKQIAQDFTLTQNYNLEQQLELGARYLDLRVSYDPKKGEFYLSHSFACLPLKEGLSQIAHYMQTHPQEVVMLDINLDHEHRATFGDKQADEMREMLNSALGDIALRNHGPIEDAQLMHAGRMKYQDLIDSQQRLIMGFGLNVPKPTDETPEHLRQLHWRSGLSAAGWINENTVEEGAKFVKDKFKAANKASNDTQMLSAGAALTPTGKDVRNFVLARYIPPLKIFKKFRNLKSTKDMGKQMNDRVPSLIQQDETRNFHGVVYCDGPDRKGVFNALIEMNRQRSSKPEAIEDTPKPLTPEQERAQEELKEKMQGFAARMGKGSGAKKS